MLHSLKSGGASKDGCKLSDPELKDRHAGWKNPCTKRRYTTHFYADVLEVTRSVGVARIFQREGHTVSNRGYSRFRNLNIVGCLSKKRLTKGRSRAPQDPLPPLATPLTRSMGI